MREVLLEYVLPCFFAFGACFGFCIIFNIHGSGIWICCAGGSLGWLVYLIAQNVWAGSPVAALLAGVAISLWSETMARIRKCPVTGYLLVAFFPLVPGGGVYYAMKFALSGETAQFVNTLMETLGTAGALALGVLLVSSGVRMGRVLRGKRKKDGRFAKKSS